MFWEELFLYSRQVEDRNAVMLLFLIIFASVLLFGHLSEGSAQITTSKAAGSFRFWVDLNRREILYLT